MNDNQISASTVRKGQVIYIPILGKNVLVTKREKWNYKQVKIYFVDENGVPGQEFFALTTMLEVVS